MFNLLAVSEELAKEGYPKEIPWTEASVYALLGFIIVFIGIAFLIGIVWLVGKILNKKTTEKKTEKDSPKKEQVVQPTVTVTMGEEEISEEVVAVITAAIMAYYETNNPKCEFTVRRIKRI